MRHWLANLHTPERLADPAMRAILRAHGRPYWGSTLSAAREASALLREKIETVRPSPDAPTRAHRPYLVLTSLLRGEKLWVMAASLGLSERQTTRERARAIALLREELDTGK